jgi:hypothetical protein
MGKAEETLLRVLHPRVTEVQAMCDSKLLFQKMKVRMQIVDRRVPVKGDLFVTEIHGTVMLDEIPPNSDVEVWPHEEWIVKPRRIKG